MSVSLLKKNVAHFYVCVNGQKVLTIDENFLRVDPAEYLCEAVSRKVPNISKSDLAKIRVRLIEEKVFL